MSEERMSDEKLRLLIIFIRQAIEDEATDDAIVDVLRELNRARSSESSLTARAEKAERERDELHENMNEEISSRNLWREKYLLADADLTRYKVAHERAMEIETYYSDYDPDSFGTPNSMRDRFRAALKLEG